MISYCGGGGYSSFDFFMDLALAMSQMNCSFCCPRPLTNLLGLITKLEEELKAIRVKENIIVHLGVRIDSHLLDLGSLS